MENRKTPLAYLCTMRPPDHTKWMSGYFDFEDAALQVWKYQIATNPVMRRFRDQLGEEGPLWMPISFFRDFELRCGDWTPETIFRSSGTTGQVSSRHFVRRTSLYRDAFWSGFERFYGEDKYTILALLPHYVERGDSSLVWMVNSLIKLQGNPGSGFFLDDLGALHQALLTAIRNDEKILLLGVSYALLDFAEQFRIQLPPNAIVMETGGMKGRRREMVREELHQVLMQRLGVKKIHSEYGMTELMSQAYSNGDGIYKCPPWMQVTITDLWVPGRILPQGQVGRICITDLMNVDTCAFIRTDDLGRAHPGGQFEVLGRVDTAEMRGCNLMVEA